ncbi:MAG: YfhO family protein [Elusimicrobia bacterium]|nr:YfhO family protein [Elusimicrobiota bacterium]
MTSRELKRAAMLFLAPAVLFFYPFLKGNTPFLGDITYSFQPWLTYAAQEIQAGRFPLWNPYSACGEPFFANPQTMLMNPLAILFWIFPFPWAHNLFLVLSQTLLYFFTYFLARRWIGDSKLRFSSTHTPAALAALAFTWGGFAVSQWEFPSATGAMAYLPLFFLFGIARCWPALAATTFLALSTGYIQFVYYGVFLSLAGTLSTSLSPTHPPPWRTRFTPFVFWAIAIATGTLLTLAQILPSWETTTQSIRTAMTIGETRLHLLTPIFLVKLWIPWITNPVALAFQSDPFGAEFWPIQRSWLTTFFLGTPVVLLSFAGLWRGGFRKTMVLSLIAAVSGILAFGIDPFFGWARTVLPGFRYLTHFSNASVMGLLCLVLWATEGAHPRRGRNLLLSLITLTLLSTSLALALSPTVRTQTLHALLGISSLTPAQDQWVIEAGGISAAATLCFVGVWLFFRHKRWAVLWCFTLLELWTLGRTLQPSGPASLFHRPVGLAHMMKDSPFRFSISPETMKGSKIMGGTNLVDGYHSLREAFYPNTALPFRVHHTWAYEVFGFQRFTEFRRRIPALPGESPALDFLGGALVMSTISLPPPSVFVGQRDNALLYSRPTALPRVTVVPTAVVRSNAEERLNYLFGPWRPQKEVVLETKVPPSSGTPQLDGWKDEPGRVAAKGMGKGWLVYSGIYYPGWEAYVNGKREPILRANHAFQAVATPEDSWRVDILYRPKLFRVGLLITLLTALGFFLWVGKKLHSYSADL